MAPINEFLLNNPWVPWRIRHQAETWLYSVAKDRLPHLFYLALLGRFQSMATPVTQGPLHHFFGYYDKTPWSADEKMLLGHRVGFMDRAPEANDRADIGIIDFNDRSRWHRIGSTFAWNWQQGSMLRWHPCSNDILLFNDREGDRFVTRFCHWRTGKLETLHRPLYDISLDGKYGFTLNFARLQVLRPGYGYAGLGDPWGYELAPYKDGVWRVELVSGEESLLFSLGELAARNPKLSMKDVPHWVNHVQLSPSGQNFAFMHRWGKANAAGGFQSRLYYASADGSNLKCLLDYGMVSHYDWMDDNSLAVWAEHPSYGKRFYLIQVDTMVAKVLGNGVLLQDGHCSFSPNREWLVTDTYPDRNELRALMLFRMRDGKRMDLELLRSPRALRAEIRCDLHPRWSPSGKYLCIDSLHEGSRQIYVLDVQRYTG